MHSLGGVRVRESRDRMALEITNAWLGGTSLKLSQEGTFNFLIFSTGQWFRNNFKINEALKRYCSEYETDLKPIKILRALLSKISVSVLKAIFYFGRLMV